jgi:hypothetical protein
MKSVLVLLLGCALAGCCRQPAVVGGRWVLIARGQSAAGPAGAPHAAGALDVVASPDVINGCFTSESLDRHFGAQCGAHETEGGATAAMTDEVPTGTQPTPAEVRWYCDKRTVLRVLLQRCAVTDTFTVSEIAVAREAN